MDFISSKSPIYPYVERIKFSTEITSLGSLRAAASGSPTAFHSFSLSGTQMPAPQYSFSETRLRRVATSEHYKNPREQRRSKFEDDRVGYKLKWNRISRLQKDTLVSFFESRKGRYNNFTIQYSEVSPYTQHSLFGGALTTVNFSKDILEVKMDKPGIWSASIDIEESDNSIRRSIWNGAYREFDLIYSVADISPLLTLLDSSKGKEIAFNFNPYGMISAYLPNITYTVRFENESTVREILQVAEEKVNITLVEVIT